MKKLSSLMLLALALFFTLMGCREEDLYVQKSTSTQLSTTEDVHKRYTSSYISSRTLQQDLKNVKVKNSVADALSRMPKANVSKSQFGDASVYECIYDAVENISTYTLPLVEYSAKNPYFLKHIITVENGVEKSGFMKIIPLMVPATNTEVLDSFSGTVQILDENMKVFSQSTYSNGVSQTAQTGSSSVSSKFDCTNVLYVIVHGCTRGDNHPPGATCDNGEVSDGYYELTTQLICGNWGPEDNTIAPSEGTIGGGGGGGATIAHQLLNHSLFQHASLLLDPNKRDLLNLAMAYIQPIGMLTGITLEDSQVIAINQKLDVFMNNPQLFDNFDLLQNVWNTTNYYFPGTANYYDQRIVKLMQNLFDNPTQQNADLIFGATQFYMQNPNTTLAEFQPMLTFAHNFLQENPNTINPEQIFQRLKDLDNALTQNPNFLINIPCSQLPDWQELANHPIPQSVINKIFQLNGNTSWFSSTVIQNLDYSKSFTVNMDVYPVKITNMPEKSPGVKYTHAEFFDYFRKNINNFTDINHGNFYPVVEPQYGIDDTQLWYSNNPIGSLITIKIPADNGTVVCSGFNSQAWIFTTVKSPWDGEHPVSGNRLFGYFVDAAGNMVIYTRGVDRFTTKVSNNALQYTVESFGYSEAKTMWQNMQQKVSTFVNNKNGNSSIIPGVDYTPSYIFIKDYLKGNKPLTALGCH
ncbi:hypothetical protein MQX03_09585 [Chryseobacterium aahli]|uniref:hypothetical protein n=1 Tax=Chryseobacterium aahli TaxID=1278643 RepID=UPI001F60C98C|nr:hypothetical protein [Chryseobacterium aahli]MCI3937454.1 hypothetical protein [Chryseobacterium aahli]